MSRQSTYTCSQSSPHDQKVEAIGNTAKHDIMVFNGPGRALVVLDVEFYLLHAEIF